MAFLQHADFFFEAEKRGAYSSDAQPHIALPSEGLDDVLGVGWHPALSLGPAACPGPAVCAR